MSLGICPRLGRWSDHLTLRVSEPDALSMLCEWLILRLVAWQADDSRSNAKVARIIAIQLNFFLNCPALRLRRPSMQYFPLVEGPAL